MINLNRFGCSIALSTEKSIVLSWRMIEKQFDPISLVSIILELALPYTTPNISENFPTSHMTYI